MHFEIVALALLLPVLAFTLFRLVRDEIRTTERETKTETQDEWDQRQW